MIIYKVYYIIYNLCINILLYTVYIYIYIIKWKVATMISKNEV